MAGARCQSPRRRNKAAPWRPPKRLHNYPACVEIMAAGETAGLRIDRPHSGPNEFLFLAGVAALFPPLRAAAVAMREYFCADVAIGIYIAVPRERADRFQGRSSPLLPTMTGLFAPSALVADTGAAPRAAVPTRVPGHPHTRHRGHRRAAPAFSRAHRHRCARSNDRLAT